MDESNLFRTTRDFFEKCLYPIAQPGDASLVQAAVLIPLIEKSGTPHLIFTRRSMTVATHKGQISFPGGMVEPGDVNTRETALREAKEEIGLEPCNVQIAGYLDGLKTVTDFWITPVVGIVLSSFAYVIQEAEVAEVFEVPLPDLRCLDNWESGTRKYRGVAYQDRRFRCGKHVIWGATGKITYALMEKLNGVDSRCGQDKTKLSPDGCAPPPHSHQ